MSKVSTPSPALLRRDLLAATGAALVGFGAGAKVDDLRGDGGADLVNQKRPEAGAVAYSIGDYLDRFVYADMFATLADAVAAAQTAGRTLLVSSDIAVTANYSLPSGLRVKVIEGGKFTLSAGVVLTVNCHLDAGFYQIFDVSAGGGAEIDGQGEQMDWRVEWWGAGPGVADCGPAFQAAFNFTTNTSRRFQLDRVRYDFTTGVTTDRRISMFGDMDKTLLFANGFAVAVYMFQYLGTTGNRLQRIKISGVTFRSDNQAPYALNLTWVNHSTIEDVFFYNLRGGVDGTDAWSCNFRRFQTFAMDLFTARNLDGCNQWNFYGCQFGGDNGFLSPGSAGSLNFFGCDFEGCGTCGLSIEPATGKVVNGVTVSGGYWELCTENIRIVPVDVEGVRGVHIHGTYNWGKPGGTSTTGIVLRRVKGFAITGNMFGAVSSACIDVNNTNTQGMIEGNGYDTVTAPAPAAFNASAVAASVRQANNG